MNPEEQQRAISLYEQLHQLLLEANKLAVDDVLRFTLSVRYFEIRKELAPLVRDQVYQ